MLTHNGWTNEGVIGILLAHPFGSGELKMAARIGGTMEGLQKHLHGNFYMANMIVV